MTEVLIEQTEQERPGRDHLLAVRRLETTIVAGDGRTVNLRIAPFNELATSADGLGGVPRGIPYQEQLMPGLYDRQLKAANRIYLNFEHEAGIGGVIGKGQELWQEPDGYHASFRVKPGERGDMALWLAGEGTLGGASVESYWLKSVRTAKGVVQRVRGHLDAVALCREGAYPSAVLTGIRAGEPEEGVLLDETLLPVDADLEVAERMRKLGVKLPARLVALLDGREEEAA